MPQTRTAKGRAQKIYISTDDGTTFTEMKLVSDVGYEITPQMEDVTTRQHGRLNREESYGFSMSANFQMKLPVDKLDCAYYTAQRDGVVNGTAFLYRLANGTTTGVEQITFYAEVSGWSESQPIGGHVVVDVTVTATSADDGDTYESAVFDTVA